MAKTARSTAVSSGLVELFIGAGACSVWVLGQNPQREALAPTPSG